MVSSASAKAAMLGESIGGPHSDVSSAMIPRENDNGPDEMDEERLHAQREIQMLDLGTGRREYVTTVDKPQPFELRQSKEKLLRARKVNEEGTEAAKWYQENKKALNAWNNVGDKIANDHADKEQLADIMGGQSHRARLNKEIRDQGGQEYSEVTKNQITDPPHSRREFGAVARGVSGRSGRGAPTHIAVARRDRKPVATVEFSKVPVGPRADRPLDPAISPDRDYSYKSKRGGKTIIMAYSGPALRAGSPLGRGDPPNNARAAMIGSTVRIGTRRSPQKAKSQHSGTSEASQTLRVCQQAPVTVALDDQAFLQVLNNMKSKPDFNNHVQEKSKPAPASRAASLFDKSAKPAKDKPAGTKKQSQPPSGSWKTPAPISRSTASDAVAIMDKDLDADLLQTPLTPESMTAPRYITYRGSRYVRTDQIVSPDVKHNQENVPRDGELARVEVTPRGLNIGLQTLQQMSTTESILGDHSPPGRKRNTESTNGSSSTSLEASQWAANKDPFLASGTLYPLQHTTFTWSNSSLCGGLQEVPDTQVPRAGGKAPIQSTSKKATLSSSKWAAPGVQKATSDPSAEAAKEATQSISSKDANAAAEVIAEPQVAERRKGNPFSFKKKSSGPGIPYGGADSEESEI